MKMNVRFMIDHDEGHCTSLVKMGSYHKNKDEDWNGFYCSFHYKLAKKYHMTPARIANLWDKYADDRYYTCLESDCRTDDFMSFDDWLDWKRIK